MFRKLSALILALRRNWFAGLAMQAIIQNEDSWPDTKDLGLAKTIARLSYTFADAMIQEGEKG